MLSYSNRCLNRISLGVGILNVGLFQHKIFQRSSWTAFYTMLELSNDERERESTSLLQDLQDSLWHVFRWIWKNKLVLPMIMFMHIFSTLISFDRGLNFRIHPSVAFLVDLKKITN